MFQNKTGPPLQDLRGSYIFIELTSVFYSNESN